MLTPREFHLFFRLCRRSGKGFVGEHLPEVGIEVQTGTSMLIRLGTSDVLTSLSARRHLKQRGSWSRRRRGSGKKGRVAKNIHRPVSTRRIARPTLALRCLPVSSRADNSGGDSSIVHRWCSEVHCYRLDLSRCLCPRENPLGRAEEESRLSMPSRRRAPQERGNASRETFSDGSILSSLWYHQTCLRQVIFLDVIDDKGR